MIDTIFAKIVIFGRNARFVSLWVALFLISMCSGAWGACSNQGWGSGSFNTNVWQEIGYGCSGTESDRAWCERNFIGTNAPITGEVTSYGYCLRTNLNTSFCSSNYIYCRFQGICCSSQCEVDSVQCVNEGKEWGAITGGSCNGKGCKECPNDTTWQEISCAYSPQRGQYLNVVNTYGVKDCQPYSRSSQYYSAECDSSGADSSYTCIGTIDGENVYMRAPWGATFSCAADGSCARAQQMIAAGECKAPKPPNSSASQQSSSSESEPTSSDSEPTSSVSEDTSGVSTHVIVDELPQRLYDSLGAIDYNIEMMQPFVSGIYDASYEMLGNQYDMKENQRQGLDLLGDIRDASEGANSKLSTTNSLLNEIKNKNWTPNINVQAPQVNVENNTDVSGIETRLDKTRDTLSRTNGLLEEILGWVSKGVSMDSFKQVFNVDSSGWGRMSDEVRGAGDSLINQYGGIMAMNNCDTTGGRKCDNTIIGVGGLDSAKKRVKSIYGELRDSMTHGAFMDSLNNWGSAFTGGGVLIGSGSNNCPSFLTRPHTITIGNSTTQMRLDGVLCATLFGNVTPWTLARVLIRSIVAFFCMVALFKAATGTMFTSEDE